jgi:hypothetical protein
MQQQRKRMDVERLESGALYLVRVPLDMEESDYARMATNLRRATEGMEDPPRFLLLHGDVTLQREEALP